MKNQNNKQPKSNDVSGDSNSKKGLKTVKIKKAASKEYWTEETEKYVKEYLENDFHWYQVKIEKHLDNCAKENKSLKKKLESNIWNREGLLNENIKKAFSLVADDDFILLNEAWIEQTNRQSITFKKDKIFRDFIQKPLNRLVENIIFNYRLFRPGVDIKTLHDDCLTFVYSKFANFNPSQNTKSFSFYGTIAKHYLLGEKKELDKILQTNLDYNDHKEEADSKETVELDEVSDLDSSLSLFNYIIEEVEREINKDNISKNDIQVGDAIISIFTNHKIIGVYQKNQVYQLIKERTGLQTKDITYSLHRFRIFYKLVKQDFLKLTDIE